MSTPSSAFSSPSGPFGSTSITASHGANGDHSATTNPMASSTNWVSNSLVYSTRTPEGKGIASFRVDPVSLSASDVLVSISATLGTTSKGTNNRGISGISGFGLSGDYPDPMITGTARKAAVIRRMLILSADSIIFNISFTRDV